MMICKNCGEEMHTPDHLTGEIHKTGKYACYGNGRRLETVAEGVEIETDMSDFPEYSGAI
jgi:hypothetical protein